MAWVETNQSSHAVGTAGWEAAMLEFEHQADHWDTPDHRETGRLIASALRAAVDIARTGGLACEHRPGSLLIDGPSAAPSAGADEASVARGAGARRHRDAA